MNDELGEAQPETEATNETVTAHSEAGADSTVPGRRVRARPSDGTPPTRIGRYRVIRRLGAGGMGVVYAAHDPELGRTVAIKVVHERFGESATLQERLKREAQALARLSHPNVVSVHDVGVEGDRLYIVMQYVDGAVLDDWIKEQKVDADGIIALFLQAGHGLAAAHAAGLVHRDFKPGNVLVEGNGTARVTDFGLARLSHLADVPVGESENEVLSSMTSGDVVGTPAYMAPEQFLGGAITAATDQFGYCIALWEALAGKRPFAGTTLAEIRHAVVTGEIDGASARALPRRIQRALRRGLSLRAADRFPDMSTLLDVLLPPRRWWIGGVAAVALAGAGAAVAMALGGGAPANPCRGADAAMDPVWTPARRDALHAAVAALATPDAAGVADAVVAKLDKQTASWRTMRLDACEAAKVRHTEDDATMARRDACLDRSLDGMRSAIDLLTGSPTDSQRGSALSLVHGGTAATDCTASATLSSRATEPPSPELARQLADLDARGIAGDDAYVAAQGPAIAAALEQAGDIEAAAHAWYRVAAVGGQDLTLEVAREAGRKAATLAAQSGDDDLEARGWAIAAEIAANDADNQSADDFLALATAAATRTGNAAARLAVETERGRVASFRADYHGAAKICEKVHDDAVATYGTESPTVDNALGCLYHAYYQLEDWPDAQKVITEQLALRHDLDGPDSIRYLKTSLDAAAVQLWSGDKVGGRAAFQHAIDEMTRIYGAESVAVMNAYWNLSICESHDGTLATPEAIAAGERSVALAEKLLPEDDLHRATILSNYGNLLSVQGDHEGAAATFAKTLEVYDKLKNLSMWAPVAYNAADAYRAAGRCDRAIPLLQREVGYADGGQIDRNNGGTARGLLGWCLTRTGQLDQGVGDLTTAIADLDAIGQTEFAAQFRLMLATAVWKTDRAHAIALANEVIAKIPADQDDIHLALRKMADESFLHPKPGKVGNPDFDAP